MDSDKKNNTDLKKGTILNSRKLHITQDFINKFAQLSGDFNPIHIDEDFAKKAGLEGTIAHGVIMIQYVMEVLEETFSNGFSFTAKFVRPARPGDVIFAEIELKEVEDNCIPFKLSVQNEKGEVHIVGSGEAKN